MTSIIRIGLVGGGEFCEDLLKRTAFYGRESRDGAQIVAVADPDPRAPGMILARERALITVSHHEALYAPEHAVDLIILLSEGQELFEAVLRSRPSHIRILSNNVFRLLWNTITRHEKALKERTRELATVLNGIQDFILVMTPDRVIVDVNQAFLEKMGFEETDVLGKTCHEVFLNTPTPCQPEDIACPLNDAIHEKKTTRKIVPRLDHHGNQRFIEVSIYPIWGGDNQIIRFIEISRDITEQKKEEEEITRRLEQMVAERTRELQETHAKLLHQDKMASLGKLSASVVHEINNPIAGILNLIMLMQRIMAEDTLSPENLNKFKKYMALMETETRRVGRIVSNLLVFSRQSGATQKPMDLNRVIDRALALNANLLELRKIEVRENLDACLPWVCGSEDQLQQVFVNLISNAVEAMDGAVHKILKVKSEFLPDAGHVRVVFQDSGTGISKENLPRIFDPFFTTKKKKKGVGLGLSIVYGIVEDHKGTIEAESEEDRGCTFTLCLPFLKS